MELVKEALAEVKKLLEEDNVKKFTIEVKYEQFGDNDNFVLRPNVKLTVEKNTFL
jgi:hypothetical protein